MVTEKIAMTEAEREERTLRARVRPTANGKWEATVWRGFKGITMGNFDSAIEAAMWAERELKTLAESLDKQPAPKVAKAEPEVTPA